MLRVHRRKETCIARQIHAIQVHQYGHSDQLNFEQIPQPEPKKNEVLIRVHAAGVNPMDWNIRSGVSQNFGAQSFPYIPGVDFAGVVENIGAKVTTFHIGQEVFGSTWGTYAQYALAPVNYVALKPKTLSFDEAATIPLGATLHGWQISGEGRHTLM